MADAKKRMAYKLLYRATPDGKLEKGTFFSRYGQNTQGNTRDAVLYIRDKKEDPGLTPEIVAIKYIHPPTPKMPPGQAYQHKKKVLARARARAAAQALTAYKELADPEQAAELDKAIQAIKAATAPKSTHPNRKTTPK